MEMSGVTRHVGLLACVLWTCVSTAGAAEPAEQALDPVSEAKAELTTEPALPAPGTHLRELTTDGRRRSYLVHIPPGYDAAKPTPVVLAFHGAMMNGRMMAAFSGLSRKSDEAGFVVVYPNGTGFRESILFWNANASPAKLAPAPAAVDVSKNTGVGEDEDEDDGAGADRAPQGPPDDVAFTAALLDDLAGVANVDVKRVYAAGMSNGGMMCHRLAAELSDRIAAVAPVTGTLALPPAKVRPGRAVPVIQLHGTADRIVPFYGFRTRLPREFRFLSVPATIDAWVEINGCPKEPVVTELPDAAPDDGTTVTQKVYGPGRDGAEVVLIQVTGGGHTWPGEEPPVKFLGLSTKDVSGNDLIWAFFERHPMK